MLHGRYFFYISSISNVLKVNTINKHYTYIKYDVK